MSNEQLVIDEDLSKGVVIGIKSKDNNLYLKSFGDLLPHELMGMAEALRIIANNSLQEVVNQGSYILGKEIKQVIQGVLSLLVRVNQSFTKLTTPQREGNATLPEEKPDETK